MQVFLMNLPFFLYDCHFFRFRGFKLLQVVLMFC